MLEGFTWFKQSAYHWSGEGKNIYIDPWGLPDDARPADVVFITHAHFDHLSVEDIHKIHGEGRTKIFAPADVAAELSGDVTAIRPGDSFDAGGIKAQAVPAYNVLEERRGFHPQSNGWVGYVLELGGNSYYHAGDTDHVQELDSVKADVAFLPIGGTYTMTPGEAAGLAKAIFPKLAVPMHYGFVVGDKSDAEVFRQEAAPVGVEILTPQRPWGEGAGD